MGNGRTGAGPLLESWWVPGPETGNGKTKGVSDAGQPRTGLESAAVLTPGQSAMSADIGFNLQFYYIYWGDTG